MPVTRLLLALGLLAVIILGAMYATESWIFAFAPSEVDELTIIYRDTRERVILSPEQARDVLSELREAASYATLDDIASLPNKYVVSHELLALEGDRAHRYLVFREHDLVTDSDYQNLRQLGPLTSALIAARKPRLPGQIDLVVPGHVASSPGEIVPFTRYFLPIAYGAADFRVYTSGNWTVDWSRQALVLAAWGERPGTGYSLQIKQISKVDRWLCVTVEYSCPESSVDDSVPSYPLDAALIDRSLLADLQGVCWHDLQGNLFASQALGSYPVERYRTAWNDGELPIELPPQGKGILTALVGDDRVQTLVVFQNTESERQPRIDRIVEVSPGAFHVYVSYLPGAARRDAVLISGYGSSWRFQIR